MARNMARRQNNMGPCFQLRWCKIWHCPPSTLIGRLLQKLGQDFYKIRTGSYGKWPFVDRDISSEDSYFDFVEKGYGISWFTYARIEVVESDWKLLLEDTERASSWAGNFGASIYQKIQKWTSKSKNVDQLSHRKACFLSNSCYYPDDPSSNSNSYLLLSKEALRKEAH